MNKAWHLRQDGEAFPVKVHIYCMEDEDLSSEAEAASFIISTRSKDQDIAEYVLDAWMALLIENEVSYDADSKSIDETIIKSIEHTGYKFAYSLSTSQMLDIHHKQNNYDDVDTLYDFIDKVRNDLEKIQDDIKKSLNQQFCRVRYGGQYNSVSGSNEIWFRISSVGFNWVNKIYKFTAENMRAYNIRSITICRDSESDNGFNSHEEYFYKAKDGALYKHMPIEEYLEEEHEHNPVFESINMNEGIIYTSRKLLHNGKTFNEMKKIHENNNNPIYNNLWSYLMRTERKRDCLRQNKENYRS